MLSARPTALLSDAFVVKKKANSAANPRGTPPSKFGRRKGSLGTKKFFCEFFSDGSLSMTPHGGSMMSGGAGSPDKIIQWEPGWDLQIEGASKFVLRTGGDETWKFVGESPDVVKRWVHSIGAFLGKKKALEEERRRVLAAISRSNLTASQEAAKQLDREGVLLETASSNKAGLYQFLSLLSPTYINSFPEVPDSVTNVPNELFQRFSGDDLVLDFENPTPQKKRLAVSLISLVQDFLETARHYGRIIVSEVFIPTKEKTIKPVSVGGVIGGEKFIVGNLLFKFAIDSAGVFSASSRGGGGGGNESAAKVAGLELQGLRAYHSTQTQGLHFPLMAMIDKKGFRLIASALLPLKELIYGSNDAAFTIHRDNERMNKLVERASRALNVKPHMCGLENSESKLMYSCVDLEGHMGLDDRFYLLDFSRAMPPVTPSKSKPNSHLFEMFRPEFVAKYKKPLCSDAYSRFTMAQPDFNEHNQEVDEALQYLFNVTIPDFAELFKERFAYYKGVNVDLTKFCLSALMHEKGVNVRYMGRLVSELVGESRLVSGGAAVVGFLDLLDDEEGKKRYGDVQEVDDDTDLRPEDFVCMEMVARVAKSIVRSRLRFMMEQLRVPVDEPFKGVVIKTLNELFSLSKESQDFWADILLPGIEQKFGFNLKSLYKGVSTRKALFKRNGVPFLMWNRLCDMLGLQFAPTIRELMQHEPGIFDSPVVFSVTDLADLGDRVKKLDFTSMAEGYLAAVNAAEMEEAKLGDLAQQKWQQAEKHFSEALMHRPDDPSRMVLVARVLIRLGRLTGVEAGNALMRRALSLTERAMELSNQSSDAQAVEVKLARAAVLEACGLMEQSESVLMKTVLDHSNSVYSISAYTKFLKNRGENELARSIEDDVKRKTSMDLHSLARAATFSSSSTKAGRKKSGVHNAALAQMRAIGGGGKGGLDLAAMKQAAKTGE